MIAHHYQPAGRELLPPSHGESDVGTEGGAGEDLEPNGYRSLGNGGPIRRL